MAKAKRQPKKKPTTRRDRADDRLLNAVANWVKVRGGNVVVAGGFQVQEWPHDKKGIFYIAVRCLGKKPEATPDADS